MRTAILVLLAIGCSKQVPHTGPTHKTELGVWVYETFPPDGGGSPVRFRLTADELARVSAYMPDVASADDYECKCGVARFGVDFYAPSAAQPFAQGDFFQGPDKLVVTYRGGSGRLGGQQAFHDALVAVIKQRGLWN